MKKVLAIVFLVAGFNDFSLYADEAAIVVDSRRELFVDGMLLDALDNVRHVPGSPVHEETVLVFDQPWEGRYCGYVTVFKDGDRFRMYYRGLPEARRDGSDSEVTCYAESADGIQWTKPDLGLFTVQGHSENNVVLAGQAPYSHNFTPFLNLRPEAPAEERYLALAGTVETGLTTFFSADGLQWNKQDEGVIRDGAFDSQNVAFWSDAEECYVCYFRSWSEGGFGGYRWVSRTTSPDFRTWTSPQVMDAGGAPPEHIYTNQTVAYYRAPHIYIALAARFMPGRRAVSQDAAREMGVEPGYFNDCSDNVLMSSRGGNRYDRTFMEGFVRPGIGLEHWTSRTNYPAWGIVPTGASEMSFYIQHNYGQPTAKLDRYSLRPDGFASIRADYDGGSFTTRPVIFSGSSLNLNFSTSAAGSVRVALLNPDGDPIDGHGLSDCDELFGNDLDRQVTWKNTADILRLAGQPVRLQFQMKDADVYAFQFK